MPLVIRNLRTLPSAAILSPWRTKCSISVHQCVVATEDSLRFCGGENLGVSDLNHFLLIPSNPLPLYPPNQPALTPKNIFNL